MSKEQGNEVRRRYSYTEAARLRDDYGWNDLTDEEVLNIMRTKTDWTAQDHSNLFRIAIALERDRTPWASALAEAKACVECGKLEADMIDRCLQATKDGLNAILRRPMTAICWKVLREKIVHYVSKRCSRFGDDYKPSPYVLQDLLENRPLAGARVLRVLGDAMVAAGLSSPTGWEVRDIPKLFRAKSKARMAWESLLAYRKEG